MNRPCRPISPRCADTRGLYREVCALLFFRYGITPTANKLYNLVRKGSMTTPADVLNRFWQDLRDRTRVKIDHPDLPDAMKQVAAEAVLSIWQATSETATGELAVLRAEARHQTHEAEAVRDQAAAELDVVRQTAASTQAELEAARAQLAGMRWPLNARPMLRPMPACRKSIGNWTRPAISSCRSRPNSRLNWTVPVNASPRPKSGPSATKGAHCAKSTRNAPPARKSR